MDRLTDSSWMALKPAAAVALSVCPVPDSELWAALLWPLLAQPGLFIEEKKDLGQEVVPEDSTAC